MKRIIKIILIISFLLNTFCLFTENVFAATSATINDSEGVFIRSGPGTNNATVALLSYGTAITLVDTTKHAGSGCDGWYQVNYGGRTDRYVCSELVAVDAPASVNTNGYYTSLNWGTRINENYATVRSYPAGTVMENIYLGTPIKVIEKSYATGGCTEGWTKISYYGGKIGYVCDRLISSYEQVTASDTEYENILKEKGFPESYWPFLTYLHQKYPNWNFVVDFTNKDFNTAVANETGKNYIQTTQPSYIVDANPREGTSWFAASSSIVAFMLDPRNYLTEKNMFSFETLSYDTTNHTSAIVKNIFGSSYLADDTYVNYFMNAATAYNISPVHLATRVKQEGGTDASYAAISGTATSVAGLSYGNNNLDGFYNYYNIGAWEDDDFSSAVTRGIATSACLVDCDFYKTNYNAPWDTREKAIMMGAKYLSDGYINNGQDTMYYQKFNTSSYAHFASYTHQFMTNIIAPLSESLSTYWSFSSLNLLNQKYTFKIPVYNNMPEFYTSHPTIGDTNNNLVEIKINNTAIANFDKDVLEYEFYVTSDKTSVNIVTKKEVSSSSVAGDGTINLNSDQSETSIPITVTSQTGTTKVYTIKIIKVDPIDENIEEVINNIDVKVNDKSMYMSGISINTPATTLSQQINQVSPNASIEITNSNNIVKTTEELATGDKIKITLNDETVTYTIAIKGDINGDGKINAIDLIRVQKHILKYTQYEGINGYACDVNYDSQINAIDLIRIQKHILGYASLK